MNILLINHYAGSPKMGMEFRPYYMAKKWQEWGNNVTIVAGSYSHIRQNQPSKLGLQKIEGINYFWLWTNKYKGNGIKRLVGMLLFILQISIRIPYILFKFKPDVIIASSTYPLDILPAWIIARLKRAKLVFEIHDLWPLSPMEIGGMSKWHPFIMLMRFGEWFAYKFSDKIISIPPLTYKHVAKDGVEEKNFLHIPNGVFLSDKLGEEKMPMELAKIIKNSREAGKLIVAYAGTLGAANHMLPLVKAMEALLDKKIVCIIVGDGYEKQSLEKYILTRKVNNVIMYSKISKNSVHDFLTKVDVLYMGGKKTKLYSEFGLSLNKTHDYMLAGKPIIEALELANKPIDVAKCGFSIHADNIKALVEILEKILKTPKPKLTELGNNGKKYVLKYHDYEKLAEQFLKFINS